MGKNFLPRVDIRKLYAGFNAPVTAYDCGQKCTPHNPNGIPFCCDICHAVPAAYRQEWAFLQRNTDLWHAWRGDECRPDPVDPQELRAATPENMLLLACKGPAHCQREFRAASCRQFPFFPYISADYRLMGLAYEWSFENTCYVISHLGDVTETFRSEFIRTYDALFEQWPDDMENYATYSEEMREHFAGQKRRIPLLHRNGGFYLLSPSSERLRRVTPEQFRRYGPYR
jgi:hypothetical protein